MSDELQTTTIIINISKKEKERGQEGDIYSLFPLLIMPLV